MCENSLLFELQQRTFFEPVVVQTGTEVWNGDEDVGTSGSMRHVPGILNTGIRQTIVDNTTIHHTDFVNNTG